MQSPSKIGSMSVVFLFLVAVSLAQQPTFNRTEFQRGDLTAAGREAVMAVAELPPAFSPDAIPIRARKSVTWSRGR
jgi:hypothetical protein